MPEANERRIPARSPARTEPWWKRNPVYRALRRVRAAVRSRLRGARLQRRVEQEGFRLVPEQALEDCYRRAVHVLRRAQPDAPLGGYLEFGVCHGASMACMHRVAREAGLDEMRFLGFDSFEGLPPEADRPGEGVWRPGDYRSDIAFTQRFLTDAGVDWSRTTLVKGWFKDTLTEAARRSYGMRKASIIMVDCDLYSSARQALDFCAPLIDEVAVVCFDDWHAGNLAERRMGERRAFEEFLADNPDLTAKRLPPYTANAEVFLLRRRRNRPAPIAGLFGSLVSELEFANLGLALPLA